MTQTALMLGSVSFQDFEVPEKIEFGGVQRVIVHDLIGGGRVVDALGGQPQEISFTGILSGNTASQRAQALDAICNSGNTITLAWPSFYYQVIINNFIVNYEKSSWMPFKINCTVVEDIVANQSTKTPILNLILNDIGVAARLATQAVLVTPQFLPTTIAYHQTQLASQLIVFGDQLTSSNTAISAAIDGPSGVASLGQLVDVSSSLATVGAMAGYINRAAYNTRL